MGATIYLAIDYVHVHNQKVLSYSGCSEVEDVHLHTQEIDRAMKDVRLIEEPHASTNDPVRQHHSWAPWDGCMNVLTMIIRIYVKIEKVHARA